MTTVAISLRGLDGELPKTIGRFASNPSRKESFLPFQGSQSGTAMPRPSTDIACLAHEQNNLFQVVICMVHTLQSRFASDAFAAQKLDELAQVLDGITRMNKSVLKAFRDTRFELVIGGNSGEEMAGQEARAPMDFDGVLERTVALARIVAGKDVQIDMHLNANGATASIPEIHLQQVMYNLLKNAMEAAPEGGSVTVESSVRFRSGLDLTRGMRQVLCVTITDNGPGIPKEFADRVFECGFTSKTEGCGLGLHYAQKILRLYGGSINLGSRHPIGTQVTILWPFG